MRKLSMSLLEKISWITTLMTLTKLSTSQRSISSNNTAFLALFTLELLESDLKPEEIETEDTPPSSDRSEKMEISRVDSLSLRQTWSRAETKGSLSKLSEVDVRRESLDQT